MSKLLNSLSVATVDRIIVALASPPSGSGRLPKVQSATLHALWSDAGAFASVKPLPSSKLSAREVIALGNAYYWVLPVDEYGNGAHANAMRTALLNGDTVTPQVAERAVNNARNYFAPGKKVADGTRGPSQLTSMLAGRIDLGRADVESRVTAARTIPRRRGLTDGRIIFTR